MVTGLEMAVYSWKEKELFEVPQLVKFMGLRRGEDLHIYLYL